MYIRTIQLINRFYKDAQCEYTEEEASLGRFSALGVYDVIRIEEAFSMHPYDYKLFWKMQAKCSLETLKGYASHNLLFCILLDENDELIAKEKAFWENNEFPYLFLSMLHFKEENGTLPDESYKKEMLEAQLRKIRDIRNKWENSFSYLSYGHSEVIVVSYSTSYKEGLKKIKELEKIFSLQKISTIFSINEKYDFSDPESRVDKTEWVDCTLNAVAQNLDNVSLFEEKLRRKLDGTGSKDAYRIKVADILGNKDYCIWISNVRLCDLVKLYLSDELLTHRNSVFRKTFYNIESQITQGESHLIEQGASGSQ